MRVKNFSGIGEGDKLNQNFGSLVPFGIRDLREGLPVQKVPKYRHCLNGGGSDPCLDFVKDLSTCTEGPQM